MANPDGKVQLKVIVSTMDGDVLDTLYVNGDYLKPGAVYPEQMLAQCIKEALEDNFDVS